MAVMAADIAATGACSIDTDTIGAAMVASATIIVAGK
jgi:hypothetical protein